jgi:hypothetical protein
MLKIDTDAVLLFLNEKFSEECSVEELDDAQTRFKLLVRYADFFVIVIASEARICLNFQVNEFDENLRNAILLQLQHIKDTIDSDLEPYKLMLWANENKAYPNIPDIEKLKQNHGFIAEGCTGPCDIMSEEKALPVLLDILHKALAWVFTINGNIGEEEGERHEYLSSRIERSRKNRALCISIYGYICQVCENTMKEKYGELADGFIHVHHLESIAKSGKKWIDPLKDLITVCPNCHSMLHRREPPLLPEELQEILRNNRSE